jgi:hypothetical protein
VGVAVDTAVTVAAGVPVAVARPVLVAVDGGAAVDVAVGTLVAVAAVVGIEVGVGVARRASESPPQAAHRTNALRTPDRNARTDRDIIALPPRIVRQPYKLGCRYDRSAGQRL